MHVVATAGHVDHGKSTLVQALTGMNPDRLAEERRRGLSIELGYCWTTLDPVGDVAFVDVPGHERFISTMLSGIGPVPAVFFVVAADDPWMPQAAEHLAALDALGVSHGVAAVTRSDLADPAPIRERTAAELSGTSLSGAPVVVVSGRTGEGLDELRTRLATMVSALPRPDPAADVRLWVDRRFTMRGAGTVVTGTLPAGRIRLGDVLDHDGHTVRVRSMESLGRRVDRAVGVARVALNLSGDVDRLSRGSALVTPDAWHLTTVVDVRARPGGSPTRVSTSPLPPERPLLHVGAATVATHCRPLAGDLLRLTLERPLPLRVGDRALVRDPGSRTIWGITVLDPAPPRLDRRGAAALRADQLGAAREEPDVVSEVERRGVVAISLLRRIGVTSSGSEQVGLVSGEWLVSDRRVERARRDIENAVREHDRDSPLDKGIPATALADNVGLPSAEVVKAVLEGPLRLVEGRVMFDGDAETLPLALERSLQALGVDLAESSFAAPTADRLRELGLDHRAVAAAAKAGRLLRLGDGVVLLPGAERLAAQRLKELRQPFTTSEARVQLETSRRVALPLLAHLDSIGCTRRLPDDRRTVVSDAPDPLHAPPGRAQGA